MRVRERESARAITFEQAASYSSLSTDRISASHSLGRYQELAFDRHIRLQFAESPVGVDRSSVGQSRVQPREV
jgi:hypothetical protein